MILYASVSSVALLLCAAAATAQSSRAQPHPTRPDAGPEVTAVTVRLVKTREADPCPETLTIHGEIETNGATTVKYTWISADGRAWPTHDLAFTAAGTQGVDESWTLGAAERNVDEWIQLQTLSPNNRASSKTTLALHCAK